MEYRADIDGLRAIAVLLVLLFHAELGASGGYIGVDVFFVISGYLITGLIRKGLDAGSFSMAKFWQRRISRIAPAATAVAVGCFVVGYFLMTPQDLAELSASALAQQTFLANVYFADRVDYFDGPSDLKPLLHMWSLAVEEQFYLLFPFIILLYRRATRLSIIALVGIATLSLLYAIWLLPRNAADTFFLLPSRSWELLLGAGLHWLPTPRQLRARTTDAMVLVGLGAILIPSVLYDRYTAFPGLAALAPCVGTALIIQAGRVQRGLVSRVLASRPLVFVGLISYSLYLIHWPLFAFLRYEYGLTLPVWMRWTAVVVSLLAATLSWWCVERPLRRLGSDARPRNLFLLFGVLSCLCITLFGAVRLLHGLPSRFDAWARCILETPPVDDSTKRSVAEVDGDLLPTFGSCDQGVDLLVWGDSHAAAMVAAIEMIAADLEVCCAIASKNGTIPLMGSWRVGRRESTEAWASSVYRFIRRNKVAVVVLVGRWEAAVSKVSDLQNDGLIVDVDTDQRTPEDSQRVLTLQLQRTVQAIRDTGARVVIVEQPPVQLIDPKRLLIWELDRGTASPSAITLGQYSEQQEPVRHAFDTVSDWQGVSIINPYDALFDSGDLSAKSRLGDKKGSYYVDTNHISGYGARELVMSPLRRTVEGWLTRRSEAKETRD